MWINTWNIIPVNFGAPFKTIMSVDIERWVVSFNNQVESESEIIDLLDWLITNWIQDISIKNMNGAKIKSYSSLVGETTFMLSHDAIALIGKTLEKMYPSSKTVVDDTKQNISIILPLEKGKYSSHASL